MYQIYLYIIIHKYIHKHTHYTHTYTHKLPRKIHIKQSEKGPMSFNNLPKVHPFCLQGDYNLQTEVYHREVYQQNNTSQVTNLRAESLA